VAAPCGDLEEEVTRRGEVGTGWKEEELTVFSCPVPLTQFLETITAEVSGCLPQESLN
jgi:hypothetical protein